MTLRIVLASASPARLTLLRGAGVEPEVIVSGVDEDAVCAATPAELSVVLARLKAEAVAGLPHVARPRALVIGADSVLELDGESHGKPATPEEAISRWRRMRGRTGVLHTGHCVIDTGSGRQIADVASTLVRFAQLDDDEIAAYVGTGEPLRVAGAFTIDGLGGPFVEGIDGDWANVAGLSLPLLRHMLRELGITWPQLWAARTTARARQPSRVRPQ